MSQTTKPTRTLLVIDRATGETERIRDDDPNYFASVARAGEFAGIGYRQAEALLRDGQEIVTNGFIRRLESTEGR